MSDEVIINLEDDAEKQDFFSDKNAGDKFSITISGVVKEKSDIKFVGAIKEISPAEESSGEDSNADDNSNDQSSEDGNAEMGMGKGGGVAVIIGMDKGKGGSKMKM